MGAHKNYWTKGVKAQYKNKMWERNEFSRVAKRRAKNAQNGYTKKKHGSICLVVVQRNETDQKKRKERQRKESPTENCKELSKKRKNGHEDIQ